MNPLDSGSARTEEGLDLEPIKARVQAARKGPWAWGRLIGDQAGDYVVWEHRGDQETREDRATGHSGKGPQRTYVGNVGACIQPVIEADVNDVFANQVFEAESADAAFIAHAREDIPALIAEVESLRAERAVSPDEASWEPKWPEPERGPSIPARLGDVRERPAFHIEPEETAERPVSEGPQPESGGVNFDGMVKNGAVFDAEHGISTADDPATTELLATLDVLYPLLDDDLRVERAGRTALALKRWMALTLKAMEASVLAVMDTLRAGSGARVPPPEQET